MGFWIRLAAYLIDGVLLGMIDAFVIATIFDVDPQSLDLSWADAVSYLMYAAYFTIGVAVWSTTIGKRIFGMSVVRMDGSRVGVGRALVRYLLYSLSALILLIGFIMVGVREDKRGLHDLICDTQVVKRRQ